jgi:hypothetical protein
VLYLTFPLNLLCNGVGFFLFLFVHFFTIPPQQAIFGGLFLNHAIPLFNADPGAGVAEREIF